VISINSLTKKVRHRFLQTFAPDRLTWEERFRPSWTRKGQGHFEAGTRTYWFGDASFSAWKACDSITIGSYCSIASGAMLVAGGNHDVGALSTYPFSMIERWKEWNAEPQPEQHITIGNDVWIGSRAMVLGNVAVGDGAVIAGGSVVVRDVPPYAIVAGVPARVVRMRLPEADAEVLRALRWWDWPEVKVLEAEPLLRASDVEALQTFARREGLLSASSAQEATLESGAEVLEPVG